MHGASHSVSPVVDRLSPAATTMLPATARSSRLRRLACTVNSRASFSVLAGARVVDHVARLDRPAEDAQEDRLAALVHRDLERQRGQWAVVARRAARRFFPDRAGRCLRSPAADPTGDGR